MTDAYERSMELHRTLRGKIEVRSKVPVESQDDLSLAYTPGVARPCEAIAEDVQRARELTIKGNSVAVVSDGSAVLGLGNIGPEAALPVMEGKALLFKEFASIDAWPVCVNANGIDDIVSIVRAIAPTFGGINLEDISAPRCFEIEEKLSDLAIPVFHDDQHGTAIVLFAALFNAAKVIDRPFTDFRVVINGAGAAGAAIARLLCCAGHTTGVCIPVREVIVCDSKGAIHQGRDDLAPYKQDLLNYTNPHNEAGSLKEIVRDKDIFIGVSKGNLLDQNDIRAMRDNPVIFAMANPTPEILPEDALSAGASVVGTGRSDYPNQVNNVLAFPGLFRGALDAAAPQITTEMKLAAAFALANCVESPTAEMVLPSPLEKGVAERIADSVRKTALASPGEIVI